MTPSFCWQERSDRSASDGSGALTTAHGNESSTREAESSGMVEKVVFEKIDITIRCQFVDTNN